MGYHDLIFPGNTITHFAGSKILLVFFFELHLFFTFNTVCFCELHLFLRLMCALDFLRFLKWKPLNFFVVFHWAGVVLLARIEGALGGFIDSTWIENS